jgi:hypothetical protein
LRHSNTDNPHILLLSANDLLFTAVWL